MFFEIDIPRSLSTIVVNLAYNRCSTECSRHRYTYLPASISLSFRDQTPHHHGQQKHSARNTRHYPEMYSETSVSLVAGLPQFGTSLSQTQVRCQRRLPRTERFIILHIRQLHRQFFFFHGKPPRTIPLVILERSTCLPAARRISFTLIFTKTTLPILAQASQ